jgi:hypothetical protein
MERITRGAHANGLWRSNKRGSVLLETLAPAEAIICHIEEDEDRYGEEEYSVDRRRLHRVRVVEKYAHTSSVRESSEPEPPTKLVGFETGRDKVRAKPCGLAE